MELVYKDKVIGGAPIPSGKGVPIGGNTGEVLAKKSNENYDTEWKNIVADGIPAGGIIIWSGAANAVPDGWALCDGTNSTPDLRGRFVLGESSSHAMGSTGGSETVTLTVNQMPSHNHLLGLVKNGAATGSYDYPPATSSNLSVDNVRSAITQTGGNQSHPNMPPYYTLCYIMKL